MKYFLTKETTAIGRDTTNDICLPDAEVSRTHLVIVRKGARHIVTDKSTNGTFVNGDRVTSKELNFGDEIKVGKWSIVYRETQTNYEGVTRIDRPVPTKIISYKADEHRLVYQKAAIEFLDNENKTHDIIKSTTTIGSAESNDIQILSDFVSGFHCRIEDRDGTYFLKDLQSTNGTLLNGQKVVETSLPYDSIIEMGPIKLKFKALEESELLSEAPVSNFEGIVSNDPHMKRLFSLIQRISTSSAPVLVHGETGTGKELIARAIHKQSSRNQGPFVAINCGAISKDLMESELFGHEKGAFTSAHQQRKGVFEQASGGTLFLDEIGELPLDLQPKLLRVLETQEIRRVGGNQQIHVDTRIVAATHRNLSQEIQKGRFREDLFYRLYVVPMELPPLQERKNDIPILIKRFLENEFGSKEKAEKKEITSEAMSLLTSHSWPGNIRELKNVISRAVLESGDDKIKAVHINFAPAGGRDRTAFEFNANETRAPKVSKTLREVEREKILDELKKNKWNKKETAKVLGIAKSTLHEKIKKYDIKEDDA